MTENKKSQNSRKLQALTLAVYRLTDKFPEGEILKQKIRRRAMAVFENFILKDFSGIMKASSLLKGCFLIARKQNWVGEVNYDILTNGYEEFISGLELSKKKGKKRIISAKKKKKFPLEVNSRQRRILEAIKKNKEGINYSKIISEVEGVSGRTISRDLEDLTEKKIVTREGWGRAAFYRIKNDEKNNDK